MKKHLSPVPGVRLALEPRIVFDAAMAALAPNVAGFASLLDLSGPQTMEVVEDAQLSFTGANAISVDYGQGHNFDAQNLFSIAVSNGQFSNTQGSLGNSVELTGVTQAAVADFLSDLKYTPDADFNGTATLTVNAQVASGGAFYSKVVEIVVAADADIVDDTLTTVKNVPVTGDLLGGFAGGSADNFEGSPSITAVSQGAHGSVTIEQNGRVTYNPDPGYAGPDSFTYTVTSGGVTETGHVSVTVYAEPIDGPSGISTNEDVGFAFTGANAISVDYGQGHNFEAGNLFSIAVSHGEFANTEGSLGNSVALTGVSQAAVADFLSDLKYTPDADFNGTATLTINAEVASGGAHYTKVMDILVAPVADIVADKLTTFKGTTVTANLLTGTHKASADNFEGAPVITSVSQGSHGKVTIGANGEVSYKPTGEYTGPDSFTYTVTSGGVTETASVSVTVKQGNVPTQIGGAISGTGTEDAAQPVTGTLVVTDANGLTDGSVFLVEAQPAHGLASIDPVTGAWSYTPHADFNGSDVFTISITDDLGNKTLQAISLLTTAQVDVVTDTITTTQDTIAAFNVLTGLPAGNADNFEDAGRAVTAHTHPLHGSVEVASDGSAVYTPASGYSGPDSFTYTVTSGGVTETAVVNVQVESAPPVDVPAIVSGATTGTGTEDAAQPVTGTLVVTDANGLTDGSVFLVEAQPAHGLASIDPVTGAWSYTPHADFNGSDVFTISITDDLGNKTLQAISLLTTAQVDVVTDTITTTQDTIAAFNVLTGLPAGNADNFEDAGRAVTAHTHPLHGSVEVASDGSAVYTPASGYSGPDSFTYTVTSGGVTETAVVNVQVESAPPVDVPAIVSGATTGTGTEDAAQPVTGTLVVTDANGLTDGSVFLVEAQPAHGVASIDPATGAWSYTPHADFNGSDVFTISITDDAGNKTLPAINLLTTAQVDVVTDTITTTQDTIAAFNVLTGLPAGNADNFEDAGRAVTAHTHPLHGSVEVASDGSAVYTPASGYSGPDSFTYTVTSGGVTETGSVVITVTADAPEPQNEPPSNVFLATVVATEDLVFSFTGVNAIGVADADNNVTRVALTVTHGTIQVTPAGAAVISSGANGSAAFAISGSQADINSTLASLGYAPDADYYGMGSASAALVMTTTDSANAAAVSTVNIAVEPVTDIVADTLVTQSGAPVTANLLTGDNGSGADSFEGSPVISAVTQGAHGGVTIAQGGAVTYTPEPGYSGADSFSYTVTSGGVSETALVDVAVNPLVPSVPVNSSPINIVALAVASNEDTAFNFMQAHTIRVADTDGNVTSVRLTVTHGTLELTLAGGARVSAGSSGSAVLTVSGTQGDINASLTSLGFLPTADDNRNATLSILTTDAGGLTAESTVDIALAPVVDIAPDSLLTPEGVAIEANLLQGVNGAGADSFEGSPVVSAVTQGAHGSVTTGEGGSVIYTPHAGFSGVDSFSYTVTSGGVTETTTVTVTVTVNSIAQTTATGTGTGTSLTRLTPAGTAARADQHPLHSGLHGDPVPFDPQLFVLPAVERSQEAAMLQAQHQNDALAPEAGSPLADPFGLSAPQTSFVSPVQQAMQAAMEASEKSAAEKSSPVARPPATQLPAHRGAEGFTTQLRSSSQSLRTAGHANDSKSQRTVQNLTGRSENTMNMPSRKP